MGNGASQVLNSEQDLALIPTAQGGLSRLAIARLQSAGVPVVPLLKRVGLPPESASAQKTPTIIRIGASSSTPGGEKLASVGFA